MLVYLVFFSLFVLGVVVLATSMAKKKPRQTWTPSSTGEFQPAGWYPEGENLARYWDGHKWIGDARPVPNPRT